MNAKQIADELENIYWIQGDGKGKPFQQYADFVRQQQAEIEALKEPKIPLLEQEIKFILGQGQCWQGEDCSMPNLMYIIRAVEAAHGIGVKQNEQ